MKILLFPILAMALFLSTLTFASAQTDNFSVGFVSSVGGPVGTNATAHFVTPQGIAVDDSGNIYVADRDNARVDKFDSQGNFVSIIGSSSSSADGYLLGPEAVAVDKSGNIYVVESNNARIDKFDSGGNFVFKFGSKGNGDGQFNDPWGIAVDDSGNIFVADLFKPIQKFDSSGNFISEIGKNMIDGATSIALDKSGNLYALDNGNPQVVEFSNDGTFIKEWGSYCNLFHNIGCVDPDGSGPFALGDGQFQDPNGIAIDSSGNVYLADTGNSRVEIFDSSGHFIYKFGENGNGNAQFSDVMGIAVSNSDSLYVVDQNNHRVETFNITYGNMTSAPNEVSITPTTYASSPQDTSTTTQPATPATPPTQPTTQVTQPTTSSTIPQVISHVAPQVTQPSTTSNMPQVTSQVTQPTTATSIPTLTSMPPTIPVWVKGIFNYYSQGQMSGNELINAINFLIQQGIVKLK